MVQCNICSREFLTAQALGGHLGSHSRDTETYRNRRRYGLELRSCLVCGEKTSNPKYCSFECTNKRFKSKKYLVGTALELDITREEVENYKLNQLVCEICRKPETRIGYADRIASLSVDHDHNTMKFRGLLCSVCNRQLGWFENNRTAILNYLDR